MTDTRMGTHNVPSGDLGSSGRDGNSPGNRTENQKFQILVVEDKEMHRRAAEETLSDHDLTIVASFDEAMKLMDPQVDEENVSRMLVEKGYPANLNEQPEYGTDKHRAYWEVRKAAEEASVVAFPFSVVLTDMMMPMSRRMLAPGLYVNGEQVPYGLIIALRATLCGVRFVAMVTDTNHHQGAMSAAIDYLGTAYYKEGFAPNFVVNGAKVMFVHTPFLEDLLIGQPCDHCKDEPGFCSLCHGTLRTRDRITGEEKNCRCTDSDRVEPGKCGPCGGTAKRDKYVEERKDWGKVLENLTQN